MKNRAGAVTPEIRKTRVRAETGENDRRNIYGMERAYERLLRYVKINTTSNEETGLAGKVPSTDCQFELARMLVKEMREMGIQDASVDEKCYVCGYIPAVPGYEEVDPIGLIAHMDTSPGYCGEGVNPQIHENYDGGPIALGTSGKILSPEMFADLKESVGKTIITTDGTTLLGADDKAGVAEIMTAAEKILAADRTADTGSGEAFPHGKICIAFTPDEEIGSGAADLDLEKFGAKYAYTVDGDCETGVVYETFNACAAVFEIRGRNVHPGSAKNIMINAALLASEISSMLPPGETPRGTEGYEGYYHLCSIRGNVESARAEFIVRDHDAGFFEARIATLRHIEKTLNEQYGEGTVTLTIRPQYRNMAEKLADCMHVVEYAKEVIRELGKEPVVVPIRGGTDGAQLSYRGLPCPNLGTGGYAFHGPYEHIAAENMDFVTDVITGIIRRFARS